MRVVSSWHDHFNERIVAVTEDGEVFALSAVDGKPIGPAWITLAGPIPQNFRTVDGRTWQENIGGIPIVADPSVPEGEVRIRPFPRVLPTSEK